MLSKISLQIALLLATAGLLLAQNSGSITGMVRDTSGGIVTGAQVVVTNTDKGVSFSAQTNTDGIIWLPVWFPENTT